MYFYEGIPRLTYWPFYIWLGIPHSIFIFVLDLHMIFCYSTFCVWQYRDQVEVWYWDIRIKFLLLMWNSHKFPWCRIQIKIIFVILQCLWMSTVQVFHLIINLSQLWVVMCFFFYSFVKLRYMLFLRHLSVHDSVVKINMYMSIRIIVIRLLNEIMK